MHKLPDDAVMTYVNTSLLNSSNCKLGITELCYFVVLNYQLPPQNEQQPVFKILPINLSLKKFLNVNTVR